MNKQEPKNEKEGHKKNWLTLVETKFEPKLHKVCAYIRFVKKYCDFFGDFLFCLWPSKSEWQLKSQTWTNGTFNHTTNAIVYILLVHVRCMDIDISLVWCAKLWYPNRHPYFFSILEWKQTSEIWVKCVNFAKQPPQRHLKSALRFHTHKKGDPSGRIHTMRGILVYAPEISVQNKFCLYSCLRFI